jgi:hypothetical protein
MHRNKMYLYSLEAVRPIFLAVLRLIDQWLLQAPRSEGRA